jgi:hypothetical protein
MQMPLRLVAVNDEPRTLTHQVTRRTALNRTARPIARLAQLGCGRGFVVALTFLSDAAIPFSSAPHVTPRQRFAELSSGHGIGRAVH